MFSLVSLKNALICILIFLLVLTLPQNGIWVYSENSEAKIIWYLNLPFHELMQKRLEKYNETSDWHWKIHPTDLPYLNYTGNSTIYVEVFLSDPEEKTVYSTNPRPEKIPTIFHVYRAKKNYVEIISRISHSYFYESIFDPRVCMMIEKNLLQEIANLQFVYCIRIIPGGKPMLFAPTVDQARQYDDLDYAMRYHRNAVGPIDIAIIDDGYKVSRDWITPLIGEAADNIEFHWDFENNDSSVDEGGSHGTTCLDLLARAFGEYGDGEDDSMYADPNIYNVLKINDYTFVGAVDAIEWCISHQMDIVCMSWGWPPYYQVGPFIIHESVCNGWWCDRFRLGVEAGVTWVAAAGNENANWGVSYPAESHWVVAVGGYESVDEATGEAQRWYDQWITGEGSNYGIVDFVASAIGGSCDICFLGMPLEFKPNVYDVAALMGCLPQGTSLAVPFVAASIAIGIYSYPGALPSFQEIHDTIALCNEWKVMPAECSQQGDVIDTHTLWHKRVVGDIPPLERYMRSDQQTVNGLTAYKLATSQSTTLRVEEILAGGSVTVYFYAKVSIRHSDGSETLIQDYFQLFNRDEDGKGYQSKTWDCPEQSLVSTDAVVVRIKILVDGVVTIVTFITEQLGADWLGASTWTFTLYTSSLYAFRYTCGSLYFGDSTYNSRIENLEYY